MNIFKAISFICIFIFVASNQCIAKHCSALQKQCKEDKSDLPCFTIVNTCLDLCPSGTDYACISFCLTSRKNELANKFTRCCSEFSCKIEKFTALEASVLQIERE